MRRCLETDCRVVWKLSAMAFGVIACNAIKVIIARLVGSAIAWKMSRLIFLKFYLRSYSVANICAAIRFRKFIFKNIFSWKKIYEFGWFENRSIMTVNTLPL